MSRMTLAIMALGAIGCGAAAVALAQSQFPTAAPSDKVSAFAIAAPTGQTIAGLPVMGPVSPSNPLPVVTSPNSTTGSTTAVSVGTTSAQVLAAAVSVRRFLAIDNESATVAVACAFGTTAALNSAGSWTIPPGMTRTWNGTFVPSDALNCIANATATPVTIGTN